MSEVSEGSSFDIGDLPFAKICSLLGPFFNSSYYTDRYPDMAKGLVDPLEHYAIFGWKEGRDPCHWFSTKRYLTTNPDVAAKGVNPLLHYVVHGHLEGRQIWRSDFRGAIDLKTDPTARMVTDQNLRKLMQYPPRSLCPPRTRLRSDRLIVHWLIPDFTPGSGGHMTIFRMINWLEFMGHKCSVWINDPCHHADARSAYDDIVKHFQTVQAQVAFTEEGFEKAKGDAIIATGWETVALALNAISFRDRFYFVQDYEPHFHPVGSSALIANWTYTQELACICAGPWLEEMLKNRFGRWTRSFRLAYDKEIYSAVKLRRRRKRGSKCWPRIALYARIGTPRRAVELVLLALEHLASRGIKFHVDLFGEDHGFISSPFPCTSHGILTPRELADLYRNADVGVCLSTTNYSLVPQEMMACGLPVVEIDGESTRSVFPEDVVVFSGPHPLAISADIAALLRDKARRHRQAVAALRWVSESNWEESAKAVEGALLERLTGDDRQPPLVSKKTASVRLPIKVTVCIPTYNGGELLVDVLRRVQSQRTPWSFDIVVVDSTSTDGSIQRCASLALAGGAAIRIETIPQSEFQHGRTRNLCMSRANGEFVAFLTQDAMPVDDFWLYNIVTVLDHFPRAAGAFGRHIAWPTASPFTRREINDHFANLWRHPLALSRDTDAPASEERWRQTLHYFSDNNSCLRRSIWQRVRFPQVDYGEDQAWADSIIKLGYEKVFVPTATVYHSHSHMPDEAACRAATEAFFFTSTFGYKVYDLDRSFEEQLRELQQANTFWAEANGISKQDLKRQLVIDEAVLAGRAKGTRRAVEGYV